MGFWAALTEELLRILQIEYEENLLLKQINLHANLVRPCSH